MPIVGHGNRLYGIILFKLIDAVAVAADKQIALRIFAQGQNHAVFNCAGIPVVNPVYCIITHNDKTIAGSHRNIPVLAHQQCADHVGRHAFRNAPLLPLPVFVT